ncbi:MAG: hypothetical protein Q7Q71_04975 [Verrucomicrobiota bacterium JB023]|nr:hypothetical protein [Verrucomicrobiota bacterium JB023]
MKTPFQLFLTAIFALSAKGEEFVPTLEILPLNSTLSEVTIPQFDEGRNRAGFLKADLMRILSDGDDETSRQVACEGVQLRTLSPEGSVILAVDTPEALYRLGAGILTVSQDLQARSDRFTLSGRAGVFHPSSRRAFVYGPLECHIFPQPEQAQLMTPLPFSMILASLLAVERPAPLEDSEIQTFQQAESSSEDALRKREAAAAERSAAFADESEEATSRLQGFAEQVQAPRITQLIQNKPAAPPQDAPEPIEAPTLHVQCEGGAFFDGKENLLVFLNQVVVTEERFKLQAGDELKLFFTEPPAEPAEESQETDATEDEDLDFPEISIGDVRLLTASGGIVVDGKDQNGNPFHVRAETATYDEKTKNLILRNGAPYYRGVMNGLQVSMQSLQNDAFVRIDLSNEQTAQVDWSKGGWTFAGKE